MNKKMINEKSLKLASVRSACPIPGSLANWAKGQEIMMKNEFVFSMGVWPEIHSATSSSLSNHFREELLRLGYIFVEEDHDDDILVYAFLMQDDS